MVARWLAVLGACRLRATVCLQPHAGMIRAGQGYSIGLASGNAASLVIINPTALEAIRVRRSPGRLETALVGTL